MVFSTSSIGAGTHALCGESSTGCAWHRVTSAAIRPASRMADQRNEKRPLRTTTTSLPPASCRATASMAQLPPPGMSATACAAYVFRRVDRSDCMALVKRADMWFSERSVKTTENSSRPSGSISARGRSMPASVAQPTSPWLLPAARRGLGGCRGVCSCATHGGMSHAPHGGACKLRHHLAQLQTCRRPPLRGSHSLDRFQKSGRVESCPRWTSPSSCARSRCG